MLSSDLDDLARNGRAVSVDAMAAVGALVAVPLALVATVVFWLVGVPWWLGIVVALVVAGLLVWRRAETADDRVLSGLATVAVARTGSSPAVADTVSLARFQNLVEGLCLRIGVREPELRVLVDQARNAMAVARHDRQSLVVTTGLLQDLSRIELEGVIAELLVRLRSGDAERATVMAALVGAPLLDSPLAGITRPLASALLRRVLDLYRDVMADQQAVAVTRYPPGLSAGLERIGSGSLLPAGAPAGIDHMWMVPPARAATLFGFAPLEWRIDVLTEI
jgi:heat shock protein HtpX